MKIKKKVKGVKKISKKVLKKPKKLVVKKIISKKKKIEGILLKDKKKGKQVLLKNKKKVAKKFERVGSGIPGLDKIIGGGFEKDSTNLIVGGTGSAKSILAMQFLLEGVKKGESCLYITFEEEKQSFYRNMLGLGWDLEKLEKQGKFFFLQYTPEKVKTMLEEGGGVVESLVLRKKVSRIVIDSVSSFILLFDEKIRKRTAALSLFNMLRKWSCTTLLTYEGEVSRKKKLTTSILEFESDSIILLYFLRSKKERKRYLEVLKMRGTEHSTKIYGFNIQKNGIKVNNKIYSGSLN